MDVLANKNLNLYQAGLVYNPHLRSAEMVEKLFVVRQKQFELLVNNILREKENSIPQHYLIIGQRGMGKTTLLKRIEIELHKEPYQQSFIPVLYREEQYNIKDLGDFWLNTLDALADSLQLEKYPKERLDSIDKVIRELSNTPTEAISEEAHKYFMDICRDLRRRPVLLIDNIGFVFKRLGSNSENNCEQWALRKLLSENGSPIFVSAGVTVTDDVINYEMPFYDFFQIQYLNKLNDNEFMKLLTSYAIATDCDETVITSIRKNISRQKSLLALTGGSPRLAVILFEQIAKGFSDNINADLEKLSDAMTPLYKARFEELPPQQQVILDAIALNWDAIPLKELSARTRLKNSQLSPQLKRLVDDGWIETTPAHKAKGDAYFISERFFNIYYIIRNSSRRHKEKIYSLSKFLEFFYGKEELEKISDVLVKQDIYSKEQMRLYMAFSMIEILEDHTRKKIHDGILEGFKHKELREEFDIPERNFLFSQGKKLSKSKQYDEAINCFDKLIDGNKEEMCAWCEKGKIMFEIKKYEEAMVCYDEIIKLDPDHEPAWVLKGRCLQAMGRHEEAIVCYNEAARLNPSSEDAWAEKGKCLREMKQYDKAINCFDKLIDDNKKEMCAWCGKGKTLFEIRKYEEAMACYDEIIKLNPDHDPVWVLKGQCLQAMGRYEETIACHDEAIRLNPNDGHAWTLKGQCMQVMERYEEAIACHDEAIRLNPNDGHARVRKGLCLKAMERYEEAVACLDVAIRLNPDSKYAWAFKGLCLQAMKRYEEAIACFDEAVGLNPNNEHVWAGKGNCLLDLEHNEEAIHCFDRAIELVPEYQSAWNNKGYALLVLKKYIDAVSVFEKLRSMDPKKLLTKFHLMFLYRDKLEKIDKAIEVYNSISETDINSDENKDHCGPFYLNKTLFELYKRNEGTAKDILVQAFEIFENENKLLAVANEDWFMLFGSVVVEMGYGSWLLGVLKGKGYDIVLSPYYTGIQALEIETQDGNRGKENAEIYLKNIAIEISVPAAEIIRKMKKYMS